MRQLKEALAYAAYMATNTFLPNVVNAIVLFYGGTLVLAGHMSAGALVSFIFYQQSLSSAFQVATSCQTCCSHPVHLPSSVVHKHAMQASPWRVRGEQLCALQSMGDVFSSLMAAVGAADKVVELIRRQPKVGSPCHPPSSNSFQMPMGGVLCLPHGGDTTHH